MGDLKRSILYLRAIMVIAFIWNFDV